jgi:hypothetical protein
MYMFTLGSRREFNNDNFNLELYRGCLCPEDTKKFHFNLHKFLKNFIKILMLNRKGEIEFLKK